MDFDSDTLVRVLEICSGAESALPAETVHLIRQGQHTLAPTVYSVWEREGRELNPALRHELGVMRTRIARYRDLTELIAGRVPSSVALKGLRVGALYPPDVVRYQNDLDYVVADRAAFWELAGLMVELGWDTESATVANHLGLLEVMVSFRKPNDDPYALPFGVEIGTHVAMGNLAGVPPITAPPPAWRTPELQNLVMLLLERFEQRYRARDLVDAAVQFDALGADFPALAAEIGRLDLWPEYAELRGLLERAELGALPPEVPAGAVAVARGRRLTRAVAPFRRPLAAAARSLQRRTVYGGISRPERRLWSLTEQRVTPARALRGGLLCFGLPVDGGPAGLAEPVVGARGDVCWVDTPIGRFLLTHGSEIDEDALAVLPVAEPAPAPVPEPVPLAADGDR